jgi:hypothetical protein
MSQSADGKDMRSISKGPKEQCPNCKNSNWYERTKKDYDINPSSSVVYRNHLIVSCYICKFCSYVLFFNLK